MKNIIRKTLCLLGGIAMLTSGLLVFSTAASAQPSECAVPLDVMVVFDRSDSMSDDGIDPMRPLTDAQNATMAFIDVLNPLNDKVGLVDFYEEAVLTNSLTTDYGVVKQGVDADWVNNWTNTGAGIDLGHQELMTNGRTGVKKVMVLLSDGAPTWPQPDDIAKTQALTRATETKADSIIIFTIGLGNNVNSDFMEEVATSPDHYFYAPTSVDLESIYLSIAETMCEPEPITVVATKIVCDDESYLPNWAATQTPINENTVADFLNTDDNGEHCSINPDWQFQWAEEGTENPGDNTGVASGDWTTFLASTQIDFSVVENLVRLWVREVWNNAYIPFTGATTTEAESAEMYCHDDTINYDNYDYIEGVFETGETYYCVAFNALVSSENNPPIITLTQPTVTISFGAGFDPTDYATADDVEDGDITGDIVVSGDIVDTNISGTYHVIYNVVDSENEPAITETLEVIVEEESSNLCRVDLDVVIVMDRSGSMDDDGTNPSQPLTAAKEAANSFVGKLGQDDQSALVSYETSAILNKGLSSDHATTQSAIGALIANGATNVGDAITLANDEFSINDQTLKIEILLSDGEANKYTNGNGVLVGPGFGRWQPAVDFAESKAQEAADSNIKIFTIGLGNNIDATMLQNIANITGGTYYYAPTADQLDEIYNQIAWDVCEYGSISGCKYEAENYEDTVGTDTSFDWEILLGGDASLTQTTSNGCYMFTGLNAGNYTISEATDQGRDFVQTYPLTSYNVALGDEEEASGYNFVNYLPTCGNGIVDDNYGEECDGGEGCSDQCLIEDVPPENIPPVITLAYDTLMLVLGEIFDPFAGHATTSDANGDMVTLYASSSVPVESLSGTTTATGTYDVVYTAEDEHGAKADPKTLTVIVNPEEVPLVCPNIVVVSNTDDVIVGGNNAMETYSGNTAWTAVIETATWIWNHYYVQTPAGSETVAFTKDFEVKGSPVTSTLMVAADNIYTVWVNGTEVAVVIDENNFQLETQDEYDVSSLLQTGTNTISFEVMNVGVSPSSPESNPAGLLYRLEIEIDGASCLNTPPVILGASNPLVFYVGDVNTELELETLARLGVTATDTEDGDITGDIKITGLAGVATSTVGTTTISYDVNDNGNPVLSAQTVLREVRVVTQCSDGLDNDEDGYVDQNDPTCSRGGEYDSEINNEENQQPIITILQPSITISIGANFDPNSGYATAADIEDGDITGGIMATSSVNTTTAGTYYVVYNVIDSEGLAAETKNMEVIVAEVVVPPVVPPTPPTGGGGGGGGGGWFVMPITISQEKVEYLGNGNAMVTWKTNIPATSQVVYGDNSIERNNLGVAPKYGYDSVNGESSLMTTDHSMVITGLTHGIQYYFRPVSDKIGVAEVVGKEVTYTFVQVPPVCNYLLEYIKLGSANDPIEVKKLEQFLNEFEAENLLVNGIYEQTDYEAVKRFQMKYKKDILDPWNHTEATGYVYITTKKKINELYCEREFPLTVSQGEEIAAFSELLSGLTEENANETGSLDIGNTVGVVEDNSNGVLANASSGTAVTGENKGLLANILNALGFGGEDEDTGTSTEGSRNLASTIYSGALDLATSFWFILLLIILAIVLFFRIRGAEVKE